jgi:hypothetical protein
MVKKINFLYSFKLERALGAIEKRNMGAIEKHNMGDIGKGPKVLVFRTTKDTKKDIENAGVSSRSPRDVKGV